MGAISDSGLGSELGSWLGIADLCVGAGPGSDSDFDVGFPLTLQ